ncbi:MAG: hypothetical protein JO362_02065 [Streptomycetaceae bacterium]|nr:hypothetical protein [Streptomycetaceae bacterium]
MLSAALALSAAVVRPRTTVARRALQVLLLLGGFLTLAFVLSGQAHANAPASPFSSRFSSTASPRPSGSSLAPASDRTTVERATTTFTPRTRQAGQSAISRWRGAGLTGTGTGTGTGMVDQTGSVTRTVRPLSLLLGTVQDAAHQVASPLVGAATGLTCPGHTAKSALNAVHHTAIRPRSAGRTPSTSRVGRTAATAHDTAAHLAHAVYMQQQTPGSQLPVPADSSSEHPAEGDGGFQHSGDTYAALLFCGVRFPLSAAMIDSAHGSSPIQRSTNVSVQPD